MKSNRKGFSLIELLVVVAIIGVLAAVGIVGYQKYIDSAKEKAALANAHMIHKALSALEIARATGSNDMCRGNIEIERCMTEIAISAKMKNPYSNESADTLIGDRYTELLCPETEVHGKIYPNSMKTFGPDSEFPLEVSVCTPNGVTTLAPIIIKIEGGP